ETESRQLDRVFVALNVVDRYRRPHERLKSAALIEADIADLQGTMEGVSDIHGTYSVYTLSSDELLHQIRRAVVVGSVGSGKTTLLKYLALRTLNEDQGFPIFIELKTVQEMKGGFADLLFD